MSRKSDEPLRGEAAWKAAREEIARKNAQTRERARKERAEREAAAAARRRQAEREDRATWASSHRDRP